MVNEQINQESKNIPGCNSKQQKRGGSYFFAYYYENKKDKFSNLEIEDRYNAFSLRTVIRRRHP